MDTAIFQGVLKRLEREWRLLDIDRVSQQRKIFLADAEFRRLKVGKVD